MPFSTVALVISTALSTVALVVASLAVVYARRMARWQAWPLEQVTRLEATSDEHDVQLAQHHERLRKVNARLAARDRRRKDSPEDEPDEPTPAYSSTGFARQPGESDLDWKRRMRAALATGGLKHG